MAKQIFNFDFKNSDFLTLYDKQVSAFWDSQKTYKAIFKGEENYMPFFNGGLEISNQPVSYELKTKISIDADFEMVFVFDTVKLDSIPLVRIGDKGSIVFEPHITKVALDTGERFAFSYPLISHTGGVVSISISRTKDRWTLLIITSSDVVSEEVSGSDSPFEIAALFDGLVEIYGTAISVQLYDGIHSKPTSETQESEITRIAEIVEQPKEKDAKATEETHERIEKITHIPQNMMNAFDKTLLDAEKEFLSGYPGLFQAIERTRLAGEFTADRIEKLVDGNPDYLVKFIYYALTDVREYKAQEHVFLYQRAKYLAPLFGKEIHDEIKELFYGFKDNSIYDSFLFGKISNENLTNDMVLTLLMEEPEIWRSLFVKL